MISIKINEWKNVKYFISTIFYTTIILDSIKSFINVFLHGKKKLSKKYKKGWRCDKILVHLKKFELGDPKRTLNFKKTFSTIMAHLKMDETWALYKATTTLYL